VSAAIHAGVVVVSGTVHGNITAERKIDLHASGRLYGNISTPSLIIEEGVVFEGACTMGSGAEQSAERAEKEHADERERLFSR
jgi:cytoskeletal protein CcmA (bactofilin family)